jgi:hypothetical protein
MENSILNITVSKYNQYASKSIDCNLLEYLNDTSLKNRVLEIRSKTTKQERDVLKGNLPGITPSAICYPTRSEANVISHTGLIAFDIDKLPPEKMAVILNLIIKIPYVAYCSLSVSGSGYWGLVPISNKGKHNQHFDALQLYFKSLEIDKPYFDTAPSNIASFRYYSYDENAYFNHEAEVFNFLYEAPISVKKAYHPKTGPNSDKNPFNNYNINGDIESLLTTHGWTYQPRHDKGSRKRYTRPGKEKGISADYCIQRKLLYVFSSDTATGISEAGRAFNHVTVYCQLECGNDWKLCSQKLKQLGY